MTATAASLKTGSLGRHTEGQLEGLMFIPSYRNIGHFVYILLMSVTGIWKGTDLRTHIYGAPQYSYISASCCIEVSLLYFKYTVNNEQ
jgi:hypothetical protein